MERDRVWLNTVTLKLDKQYVVQAKPILLDYLLTNYLKKQKTQAFHKLYAHGKLVKMVESYRRDMLFNAKDFVYEQPD